LFAASLIHDYFGTRDLNCNFQDENSDLTTGGLRP